MVDGSSAVTSSGGSGSVFWSPQALYSVHLHVVKTPIHTLKINKSLNTVECGDVCLCFQHLGGRDKQISVALQSARSVHHGACQPELHSEAQSRKDKRIRRGGSA